VYEGTGWGLEGTHTADNNSRGYAASFIGNFMKALPTAEAMQCMKFDLKSRLKTD